jgi:hypothetical protein
VASTDVTRRPAASEVAALLDSPEIGLLIEELQATRWTGRPGYPIRTMIGLCLVKSLFTLPTWTRTTALVAEHWKLQRVLGCEGNPPSVYAAYRFAEKLRAHGDKLERCIDSVVEGLKSKLPDYGTDLAIDASDMPAYANGQRYTPFGEERTRFSDPDATWGHRSAVSTRKGGGYYGYKLHLATCSKTGLPVAWQVETGSASESRYSAPLIDTARRRGMMVATAAMDKGYDIPRVYDECAERECLPIIPLRATPRVKRGEHLPPSCEHGPWKFAGSDHKRGAAKWRCPTGECRPASTWIKVSQWHPLVPRETKRWKGLYRKRGSVEREFGRLKNEWGLKPLRVRGLERVRLHADLTVLTRLACTLSRARALSNSTRTDRDSRPPASNRSRREDRRARREAPLRA